MMKKEEVYLVIFYSYIFKAIELNYDIYGKEFFVVFKA